jgi:hypothetical protein
MPLLSFEGDLIQHKALAQAIAAYNAMEDEVSLPQKVHQLQIINYLIERTPSSPELSKWLNNTNALGWERQLQKIGVHRDASAFLKSMEFARAMQRLAPHTARVTLDEHDDLYTLLAERDALLKNPGSLEAFQAVNQRLFALAQQDEVLQEKIMKHQHMLALTYAKLEAIKGVVEQNFEEYVTRDLSTHLTHGAR